MKSNPIADILKKKKAEAAKAAKEAAVTITEQEIETVSAEPVASDSPVVDATESVASLASTAITDRSAVIDAEGRDRAAQIKDIRTILEDQQIRTLVDENPEAYSEEKIRELAIVIQLDDAGLEKSIASPIIVTNVGGDVYLREGKRRIMACTYLAELEKDDAWFFQPVHFRMDRNGEDIELFQFNANNSKLEVDLKTTAALFKKKIAEGMSQKALADASGYTTSKVSRILKIATYPEIIQQMIFEGDLPYTGKVLEKALKEFRAEEKRLSAQPNLDEIESESGMDESVSAEEQLDLIDDSVLSSDYVESELLSGNDDLPESSAPSDSIIPKKSTPSTTSNDTKSSSPKKPTVTKKTGQNRDVTLEAKHVKNLYSLVRYAEVLAGLKEPSADLTKAKDRVAMIDAVKGIDELLSAMEALVTEKAEQEAVDAD